MNEADGMQDIFTFTSASPDLDSSLKMVEAPSDAVFEPAKLSNYSSLDHWSTRLALQGASILYVKDQFDQCIRVCTAQILQRAR